ncbi:hypothetical protein BKI49_08365 [Streptomyces sp. Tue6028]|uniref:hypothetical protein n=1 Tax=Streptomyces sp. Tue6028 TaxID=2036037 RepID=UPI000BB37C93|nr:hypothetical protein [Streptomyces sp. Tue6028]PBC64351.1 hypothetical protein BKI49_08365 [Streptomyces sp. Tue6028]
MSRTVHHVPAGRRATPPYWTAGLPGPLTAHHLTELRLSGAESARARREGRRAVPYRLVRSFAAYTYPRALDETFHTARESTARAELRAFRTAARKLLHAAPPGELLGTAQDLDHPPTRHRHRNLWEC